MRGRVGVEWLLMYSGGMVGKSLSDWAKRGRIGVAACQYLAKLPIDNMLGDTLSPIILWLDCKV